MIKLGKHSYACDPDLRGELSNVLVGNYTSIAQDCVFDCGFQHQYKNVSNFPLHILDPSIPSNVFSKGDIEIGSDVWMGERCIIMSGVTIGHGCVIGAGSIITKSLSPFTIFTNKKIWNRFLYMQRRMLLDIAWWEWEDERVLANSVLLASDNISDFIQNYV